MAGGLLHIHTIVALHPFNTKCHQEILCATQQSVLQFIQTLTGVGTDAAD